ELDARSRERHAGRRAGAAARQGRCRRRGPALAPSEVTMAEPEIPKQFPPREPDARDPDRVRLVNDRKLTLSCGHCRGIAFTIESNGEEGYSLEWHVDGPFG